MKGIKYSLNTLGADIIIRELRKMWASAFVSMTEVQFYNFWLIMKFQMLASLKHPERDP